MRILIYIILLVLLLGNLVIGLVHINWRDTIVKEQEKRKYGKTAGRRYGFRMPVTACHRQGLHLQVSGVLSGIVPERGQVIYAECMMKKTNKQRDPEPGEESSHLAEAVGAGGKAFYVLKAEILETDTLRDCKQVQLCLFQPYLRESDQETMDAKDNISREESHGEGPEHSKNDDMSDAKRSAGKKDSFDDRQTSLIGYTLTNLPESENYGCHAGVPFDKTEFPIIVRRPWRNLGTCLCTLSGGVLMGLLSIAAAGHLMKLAVVFVVSLLLCCLLLLTGLYRLADFLRFRVILDEDHNTEIRKAFSRKLYDLRELRWRMGATAEGKQEKQLRIRDTHHHMLAVIDEKSEGFREICTYLDQVQEKRKKERRCKWLLNTTFYVPVLEDNVGLLKNKAGILALPAYTNPSLLKDDFPEEIYEILPQHLEQLVEKSFYFTLMEEILIFVNPDKHYTITKEEWETLQEWTGQG